MVIISRWNLRFILFERLWVIMCGFVGYTGDKYTQNIPEIIEKMNNRIKHRGPDDVDYYIDEDISLGFRRLSIIDLEGGRQPIYNEDKSLVLVFNGEIYNYQEVREVLIEKGHIFATSSDSEVLVHGYEEFGTELFNHIRGMFAFVIWDKKNKKLFGARDFFGIKPFYYGMFDGMLIFGSEIKSFLEHPGFELELNERQLENYLTFQYSPGQETFFKNVYKLLPAHYFVYEEGKLSVERYWIAQFDEDNSKSYEQWVDYIAKIFQASVEAHKISDVEVGSFLSSGIDSSFVACSANVDKTFTVGFDNGTQYNETSYAKELSDMIGVNNISKIISKEEYWDNFAKIQYHMDEPLADPSAVALYFVCNEASKHLKVCLSGEGADELFGGYNIYKEPVDNAIYYKIPYFIRATIGKIASRFPKMRGVNFLVRCGKKVEDKFIGNAFMFDEQERKSILNIATDALEPKEIVKPFYDMVKNKDTVTKMQFVDINNWLMGDILLKSDKMSMANSLEVRVPFLDKEIMKAASKVPLKYRVNKTNTKYILRQAAAKKLPDKWASKKKLGFPVPIRVWLTEFKYYSIVKNVFLSNNAKRFFKQSEILELLEAHYQGKTDNSRKIWTIYSFLVWYEQFFVKDNYNKYA